MEHAKGLQVHNIATRDARHLPTIKSLFPPQKSTFSNINTPSFWDQEIMLCLELKYTKSTNCHLEQ